MAAVACFKAPNPLKIHNTLLLSCFEEGFEVHHRKTRIMRQGVWQDLAGQLPNYEITNLPNPPSVFNQPSMAFRAIAVRVVEEFFIVFGE